MWQHTGEVLHSLNSSPKDSTSIYSPPPGSQGASLNMGTVPEEMPSGAPQAHSTPKSFYSDILIPDRGQLEKARADKVCVCVALQIECVL
jgi:hypothetical protein